MRARVAKKFESIGFGAGECVFMAENDAGRILFESPSTDETAARAAFGCARNGEFLCVSIEGRCGVLHNYTFPFPLFERGGGTRIDVVAGGVSGKFLPFFRHNQILRMRVVVFLLHFLGNLVVWLREDFLKWGK